MWVAGSGDSLNSKSTNGTFTAKIVNSTLIGSDKNTKVYYTWVNTTAIEIQLRTTMKGYAGLGYGATRMKGTDMTVCRIGTNGYECKDYTGVSGNVVADNK